jgi:DNA helicase-2/ATP-dependent DNA helicase PcrA
MKLLTMHKAKGREFDAVAVVDLHDGRVPDFRARSIEEVNEGKRLLYVAITRAKRILFYFTDEEHPRNVPSRFLGEGELGVLS